MALNEIRANSPAVPTAASDMTGIGEQRSEEQWRLPSSAHYPIDGLERLKRNLTKLENLSGRLAFVMRELGERLRL